MEIDMKFKLNAEEYLLIGDKIKELHTHIKENIPTTDTAELKVSITQGIVERQNLVLTHTPIVWTTQENLYRLLRKKGYAKLRKTFTRDIDLLIKMGKLDKERNNGGIQGNFCRVKRRNLW